MGEVRDELGPLRLVAGARCPQNVVLFLATHHLKVRVCQRETQIQKQTKKKQKQTDKRQSPVLQPTFSKVKVKAWPYQNAGR